MKKIDFSLLEEDTLFAGKYLLGKVLAVDTPFGKAGGIIVETESYLSSNDPACHASRGKTKRNEHMFLPSGAVYVYQIYGMYHCLNIVTSSENTGEAVLIRALKPTLGIETLMDNRKKSNIRDLCSGPGKLVMALGIDKTFSGQFLYEDKIGIYDCGYETGEIISTSRIGISEGKELPYRFYLKDEIDFVSRK